MTKDLVPVSPAAHYTIGGVKTGLMAETNVKGLFACGEVACTGVHGANRLASNSLLECIVFAKRAVDGAIESIEKTQTTYKLAHLNSDKIFSYSPSYHEVFLEEKNNISRLMTKYVEIVRSADALEKACTELERISQSINELSRDYKLKLQNMIDVSLLITRSALLREESRGAHIRQDFPRENPNWRAHIIWRKNSEPVVTRV